MKVTYIELKGAKHPLCYNFYSIEKICDEFGSLDAMQEALTSKDQGEQISALSSVLKILLAGGREYFKEMEWELPPAVKNPAALIDATSPEAVNAIFSAFNNDKKTEVDIATKNGASTQDN